MDFVVYLVMTGALYFALGPTTLPADGSSTCASPSSGARACVSWNGTDYILTGGKATSFLLLVGVIWLAYHSVIQVGGGTIGKRLAGLAVVDAWGAPARFGQTVVRSLPLAIGAGLMGVGLVAAGFVGFIMILAHRHHQRVGDLLAKTYVVRVADVGSPARHSG